MTTHPYGPEEFPLYTRADAGADTDEIDPVGAMHVRPLDAPSAVGVDGTTYYFCGEGCRRTFLASTGLGASAKPIQLGRKPHE